MSNQYNAEMLILARESRGLTQKELAAAAGISQGNISKYENGQLGLSEEHIAKIATVLGYHISFFIDSGKAYRFRSSSLYHRKKKTVAASELRPLEAQFSIFTIHVDRLLEEVSIEPAQEFSHFDVRDFNGKVDEVAKAVRRMWGIGPGPINNLVELVEDAGGLVYRTQFGTRKLDALSQWCVGLPPVFYLNTQMPSDRERFSLAHELGHIFLHEAPLDDLDELERQADQFASELLMPAEDITPELSPLSIPILAKLKEKWRVSMAALVKRAFELGRITERQYRALFEQLSRLGYRINEPIPIPAEEPTLLEDIIDVCLHQGMTIDRLSGMLGLHEREFSSLYLAKRLTLRIVS